MFDYVAEVRQGHPIARYISDPRLPSILTESLAVHLIRQRIILPELNGDSVNLGGQVADVVAGSGKLKVEVKAAGKNGWVQLGKKDLKANYLLWIDFTGYFRTLFPPPITIYVIKNPGVYLSLGKPVLREVLARVGRRVVKAQIDLTGFLAK